MNSKSAGYPRFRLFTPNPPFLGVFAVAKKNSGSACIDASRLIFQSAVSFQIRLVAKKQAGPTRFFAFIPAIKPSEFTERTLILGLGITDQFADFTKNTRRPETLTPTGIRTWYVYINTKIRYPPTTTQVFIY